MTHSIDEVIVLAYRILIMSARPGGIKEILDVGAVFGRPRMVEVGEVQSGSMASCSGACGAGCADEVLAAAAIEHTVSGAQA